MAQSHDHGGCELEREVGDHSGIGDFLVERVRAGLFWFCLDSFLLGMRRVKSHDLSQMTRWGIF